MARPRVVTDEIISEVLFLRARGCSIRMISSLVGIGYGSVRRILAGCTPPVASKL
jgi:hypothetical protein